MDELERALAKIRAEETRRNLEREQLAEAERRRRTGSTAPTQRVQELCEEFRRLIKAAPLPLATLAYEKPERPQRHTLAGRTTPKRGVLIFRKLGIDGWLTHHDGGLVITTQGHIITGVRHSSSELRRQVGAGYACHLMWAKVGSYFIETWWPYTWKANHSFLNEHPDYPGRGPTFESEYGLHFVREDLLSMLRRSQ